MNRASALSRCSPPPPPLLCVILLLQHVFLLHFANICRGGACVFLSSSFLAPALSFAPTPQLSAVFRVSAVSVRAMMATNMEKEGSAQHICFV